MDKENRGYSIGIEKVTKNKKGAKGREEGGRKGGSEVVNK